MLFAEKFVFDVQNRKMWTVSDNLVVVFSHRLFLMASENVVVIEPGKSSVSFWGDFFFTLENIS